MHGMQQDRMSPLPLFNTLEKLNVRTRPACGNCMHFAQQCQAVSVPVGCLDQQVLGFTECK